METKPGEFPDSTDMEIPEVEEIPSEPIVPELTPEEGDLGGQPATTLTDRTKQLAVAGLASAIVAGSTLVAGSSGVVQDGHAPPTLSADLPHSSVVVAPADSTQQFVVAETGNQYSFNPDTKTVEASAAAEAQDTTNAEQPNQTITDAKAASASQWWAEVPPYNQHDLKYKGAETDYGCVPTSASMILDYWHSKSPTNQTLSAQQLLDTNADQGEFVSTGMSASALKDELEKAGYVSDDHTNSTKEELQNALKEGPVIATVKLNMATSGSNHSVVVSGMSDDGQVRVVDPWNGSARTYAWEEFSRSWSANFGKDAPRNNFVTIRPR